MQRKRDESRAPTKQKTKRREKRETERELEKKEVRSTLGGLGLFYRSLDGQGCPILIASNS
jgi:beta-phosphoglucomutase-like phosphatase (HAD superfamily)